MSNFNDVTSYIFSAKQLISNGFEFLKNDLFRDGVKLTAISGSKRVASELNGNSGGNYGFDYGSLAKKLISIGIASTAVFGSAFYIGYQLARRRHRFHVREADKNDQVETSIRETYMHMLSILIQN